MKFSNDLIFFVMLSGTVIIIIRACQWHKQAVSSVFDRLVSPSDPLQVYCGYRLHCSHSTMDPFQ